MPTTVGPREVPDNFAGDLADLFAVQHDLETARSYAARAKREWGDVRTADWGVVNGLSEAAVVRYARCFTSGRRLKLDESSVPSQLVDAHRAVLELRNRHVAHPINDFEHGSVTIQVVEPPSPRKIHHVGMGVSHLAGFNPPRADELIELCDGLLASLRPRIEELRVEVEARVKALNLDEVYSWTEFTLKVPSGKQRPYRPRDER